MASRGVTSHLQRGRLGVSTSALITDVVAARQAAAAAAAAGVSQRKQICTVTGPRMIQWRQRQCNFGGGRGSHQGAAARNKKESPLFYWTTTLAL